MQGALPPIFAGLGRTEANEAASYLRRLDFQAGDVLMYEGETDDTLAFLIGGSVELWSEGVKVGSAGPRDMLGEAEVFTGIPRVCSATATGNVSVYALDGAALERLRANNNPLVPALERAVIRRLGDRIRLADAAIAERVRGRPWSLTPPPPPSLFQRLSASFRPPEPPPPLDVAAILAERSPFQFAGPAFGRAVASFFLEERPDPESIVASAGEEADRLWLVVEGKLEGVLLFGAGSAEVVSVVEPGQLAGAVGLNLGNPRSLTWAARGPTVLLQLPRPNYLVLHDLDESAGTVFRHGLTQQLVRRLVPTQGQLAALERQREKVRESRTPMGTLWRD